MSIIYFSTPFDSKYKNTITNLVIEKIQNTSTLKIKSDTSYEGGFNLPFNEKWKKYDFGPHLNKIIEYHDSRQLRYYYDNNNNKIIGLRYKDGIKYWDQDEIDILFNALDDILSSNNFN
jgi:hypothetical protein